MSKPRGRREIGLPRNWGCSWPIIRRGCRWHRARCVLRFPSMRRLPGTTMPAPSARQRLLAPLGPRSRSALAAASISKDPTDAAPAIANGNGEAGRGRGYAVQGSGTSSEPTPRWPQTKPPQKHNKGEQHGATQVHHRAGCSQGRSPEREQPRGGGEINAALHQLIPTSNGSRASSRPTRPLRLSRQDETIIRKHAEISGFPATKITEFAP